MFSLKFRSDKDDADLDLLLGDDDLGSDNIAMDISVPDDDALLLEMQELLA